MFADNVYEDRQKLLEQPIVDLLAKQKFYVTQSRRQPMQMLADLLAIREMKIKDPSLTRNGVRGILYEGPSGIGKSCMQVAYLKAHGISFYQLTPTDPVSMKTTLLKAYHEGAMVIADEINTMPREVEILMNALLSGFDEGGNQIPKADKEGFFVIGTQNNTSFKNRKTLSPAFENRFLKIMLPEYTNAELIEIVGKMGAKNPERIVEQHLLEVRLAALKHEIIQPTSRDLFRQVEVLVAQQECEQLAKAVNSRRGLGLMDSMVKQPVKISVNSDVNILSC